MKLILIIGCQRSGTTLLASMLGRHSEINMLFESTSKDILKLIGKKYSGNKLCLWRQIRLNQRASKWGYFVNRIVNLDFFFNGKYQNRRPYPTSKMSINDYIEMGATIISIKRDKISVIKSLLARTPLSKTLAENEFDNSSEILDKIREKSIQISFSDLVSNPEQCMRDLCSKFELEYEDKMLEGPKYNIIYPHDSIIKEKGVQSN